jgi:hypothetical protein
MAGVKRMKTSFRNFMEGIIDYAGLFPPASLELEIALANYRAYLEDEHSWILGRYIIPATLTQKVSQFSDLTLSVLVGPELSETELQQIQRVASSIEIIETKIPDGVLHPGSVTAQLMHLHSRLEHTGCLDVQIFLECARDIEQTAAEIAAFNHNTCGNAVIRQVGVKLRCGGTTPEAFPPVKKVASVIGTCRRHDIPLKFTAGMHQPLRSYVHDPGTMQHGFINIFAAALFCWHHPLADSQIAEILTEEQQGKFIFTENELQWRTFSISAAAIQQLRNAKVISFGSCSFTEPCEALRSLELL